MANPNYGVDLSCTDDLSALLNTVSGTELMGQVCVRRLYCRKGSLLSNPLANTLDARDFISSEVGPGGIAKIQGLCQAALLDDERVFDVQVVATFSRNQKTLSLAITGTGAQGPFALVLGVSSLTVELLKVN